MKFEEFIIEIIRTIENKESTTRFHGYTNDLKLLRIAMIKIIGWIDDIDRSENLKNKGLEIGDKTDWQLLIVKIVQEDDELKQIFEIDDSLVTIRSSIGVDYVKQIKRVIEENHNTPRFVTYKSNPLE